MKLSDISGKKLFAKGKRGVIYVGKYRNKKVAIKVQRKDIPVTWSMKNEADKLKLLNEKAGIGPKLLSSGKDYVVYEFVEGVFIPEFIEKASRTDIKKVLKECFRQCFVMDQLGLGKDELTNPFKHIIIKKAKKGKLNVTMIDFERCKNTPKPGNVTQFVQYVTSKRLESVLRNKGFEFDKDKVIAAAKGYKSDISEDHFKKILKVLSLI